MNIDFLDYFYYDEPKIVEYHKDNVDVVIRDGELGEKEAVLLVDGNQWTAHENLQQLRYSPIIGLQKVILSVRDLVLV